MFVFQVRRVYEPGGVRLLLEGELDLAAAPILRTELDLLERLRVARVVVDLRRLTFVDVAGARLLVAAQQRAACDGRTVTLLRGCPAVTRLFDFLGAAPCLTVAADPEPPIPELLPLAS